MHEIDRYHSFLPPPDISSCTLFCAAQIIGKANRLNLDCRLHTLSPESKVFLFQVSQYRECDFTTGSLARTNTHAQSRSVLSCAKFPGQGWVLLDHR